MFTLHLQHCINPRGDHYGERGQSEQLPWGSDGSKHVSQCKKGKSFWIMSWKIFIWPNIPGISHLSSCHVMRSYKFLMKVCNSLNKRELSSSYIPADAIGEGPKISNLKALIMWFCPYLGNPVDFVNVFLLVFVSKKEVVSFSFINSFMPFRDYKKSLILCYIAYMKQYTSF